MKIDPVTEARKATLFLIAGASSPFVPWASSVNVTIKYMLQHTFSRIKPRIFPSHLQRAQTIKISLEDVSREAVFGQHKYGRYRCICNPRLGPFQYKAAVALLCSSFHACGVRTVVWFG